jgi:MFS family permease
MAETELLSAPSGADTHRNGIPGKHAGTAFIFAYVFAYLGIWMAALTPMLISLPIRVRQIDPDNYFKDLSLILSAGALLAMLSNPFFGRLSDRTTSRFGMRRPWLIVGALTGTIGVLMIALLSSIVTLTIGWCLAQVATNILLAVTTAILPDQIPSERRGAVSGYLSMSMAIAPTLGAFIVRQFIASPLWMFLMPALIMGGGSLILAALLNDRRMKPEDVAPYTVSEFLSSYWVNWVKYPDFSWIWLSRFMRFISLALLHSYQVFYVVDHLGRSKSEISSVMLFSTITTAIMGTAGANCTGLLSDRIKKRKIFVLTGSILYGVGMLMLAFSQSLPEFYCAIAVCGLSQGIFNASDFAVVSEVLPEARTQAAKNMGVFNISSALPQSIAPLFAPFVLALGKGHNYTALFIASGLASFIGAGFVPLIKKVR